MMRNAPILETLGNKVKISLVRLWTWGVVVRTVCQETRGSSVDKLSTM